MCLLVGICAWLAGSSVHVAFGCVSFAGHDIIIFCHQPVDLIVVFWFDEGLYVDVEADARFGW